MRPESQASHQTSLHPAKPRDVPEKGHVASSEWEEEALHKPVGPQQTLDSTDRTPRLLQGTRADPCAQARYVLGRGRLRNQTGFQPKDRPESQEYARMDPLVHSALTFGGQEAHTRRTVRRLGPAFKELTAEF
ncbi:hypothetical protein P7K49_014878 [Saguinus oedipus]|uniref:Uncharacterized protein n=1 Tax=Saguinus oedipus TaxID=9490 RepID=A0ABQ9V7M9_SAGOE|nr:hypothetical protein P7K49_014878 [Saguinus oedipus]